MPPAPAPSFRQLYDEHAPFVWRILRQLGVRERDVADAAQEVFLVVHRRLPDFRGEAKMTTWLFGICMRVAASRRRKASERREVPGEGAPEPIDERSDVSAAAERNEAARTLEAILDRMPLEQRAVFVLFEIEAMRTEDIAQMLDVPVGTVKSRLRLARGVFEQAVARLGAREASPRLQGAAR